MENLLTSVHQRKPTKKIKPTKKKSIKVVYISNPMKIKASASEFRALVQELTGQDAELPDPSKFTDTTDDDVGGNQTVLDAAKTVDDDALLESPTVVDPVPEQPKRVDFPFEPFDDVFTPQMLENFTGLFPSSLLYESAQVDVLRSLDAM